MVALLKKDLILSFGNKQSYFLLVLYPIIMFSIIGFDNPEVLILASIVTFTYMLSIISFAYEGTYNNRLLIDSLPLKKWEIVISKYILILLIFGLSIFYTYMYAGILDLFGLGILDYFSISIVKNTFFLSLFSLAIALPLLYILPPTIARFIYILIYIIITNIFVLDGTASVLAVIQSPIFILSFYFVSMGISIVIYRKRDL